MEANMITKKLLVALAFALTLATTTSAYAGDVEYCQALVQKYHQFITKYNGHSPNPGTADGQVAVDQCQSGNPAGIPVLEQKLRDAKVELPKRT
jgi:hypothetical protein